jgi:hypothetical protein
LALTKLLPRARDSNGGSFLGLFSLELDRLLQSDRKKAAHGEQSFPSMKAAIQWPGMVLSAPIRLGSGGAMSNDNEGVPDPRDDQDDSQNVHHEVVSGMIAKLIGDREGRGRQHEMG